MRVCMRACMGTGSIYVIHCVQTQSVFIMLANKEMVCVCVCVCFNGRESERESNDSEYVMFKVFPVVWFDVVQVFVWVLDQSLMCMCV